MQTESGWIWLNSIIFLVFHQPSNGFILHRWCRFPLLKHRSWAYIMNNCRNSIERNFTNRLDSLLFFLPFFLKLALLPLVASRGDIKGVVGLDGTIFALRFRQLQDPPILTMSKANSANSKRDAKDIPRKRPRNPPTSANSEMN